jgi:hypothetical protein
MQGSREEKKSPGGTNFLVVPPHDLFTPKKLSVA